METSYAIVCIVPIINYYDILYIWGIINGKLACTIYDQDACDAMCLG